MMKIKDLLAKAIAVLFVAMCMLGMFAVTGFPEPMSRQLFIAVGTALALQLMLPLYASRQGTGRRQAPDDSR